MKWDHQLDPLSEEMQNPAMEKVGLSRRTQIL